MTIRIICVLFVVGAWTMPAFAHEPSPEEVFRCGKQFVTFFAERKIEEADDEEDLPHDSHLVMTVRKRDVQWILQDHWGLSISVCDNTIGEDFCFPSTYRFPISFYSMIIDCLD